MKNSVTKKIIKILLTIFQILILIPSVVLQYLSDKKMGVNRYLVFKKTMFSKEIFTPDVMLMFKIMLILGMTICIVFLAYHSLRKINNNSAKALLKLTLLNLVGIFYVFSKQFETMLAYHFFLIAIFVIIILQYLKLFLGYKKNC